MNPVERRFYLGVDLGQRKDYTAVALVEKRLKLGTSYEKVGEEVRRMVESVEKKGRCEVVVDATGIGAVIVEMLERSVRRVAPVVITGGGRSGVSSGKTWGCGRG